MKSMSPALSGHWREVYWQIEERILPWKIGSISLLAVLAFGDHDRLHQFSIDPCHCKQLGEPLDLPQSKASNFEVLLVHVLGASKPIDLVEYRPCSRNARDVSCF